MTQEQISESRSWILPRIKCFPFWVNSFYIKQKSSLNMGATLEAGLDTEDNTVALRISFGFFLYKTILCVCVISPSNQ